MPYVFEDEELEPETSGQQGRYVFEDEIPPETSNRYVFEDEEDPDAGLGVVGRVAKAVRQAYQSLGKGGGTAMQGLAMQVENAGVLPPPNMTPGMLRDWKAMAPKQVEAVKRGDRIGENPLSQGLRTAAEAYKVEEGRPLGFGSDVINSIAEFVPSMALTAVNPVAGTALTFEQLAGGKYEQYIAEGKDPETAYNASMISALLNTPVEQAGNLLQIGKIAKLLDTKAISSTMSKGFKKYVKTIFENALTEGGEELVQNQFDIIADQYANNPDADPVELGKAVFDNVLSMKNVKESGKAFAGGFAGGLVMTGAASAMSGTQDIINKKGWIGKESDDTIEIRNRITAKEEEKASRGEPGTLTDEEVNQIVHEVRSSKPIDILTVNKDVKAPPPLPEEAPKPIDILKEGQFGFRRQEDVETGARGMDTTIIGVQGVSGKEAKQAAPILAKADDLYTQRQQREEALRRTPEGMALLNADLASQDPYLADIAGRLLLGEQLDLRGIDPNDIRALGYLVGEDVVNRQTTGQPVPVRESRGLVTRPIQPEFVPAGLLPEEQRKLPAPEPGILPPPPADVGPSGPGQFAPTRRPPIAQKTGPVIPMGVLSKGDNPNNYTGMELRQIAKDRGIDIPGGMLKKSDMIAFIKANKPAPASPIKEISEANVGTNPDEAFNFRDWVNRTGGLNLNDKTHKGTFEDMRWDRNQSGRKIPASGYPQGMWRNSGMGMDERTLQAIEAGWLPEGSTEDDFIEMLEKNPGYKDKYSRAAAGIIDVDIEAEGEYYRQQLEDMKNGEYTEDEARADEREIQEDFRAQISEDQEFTVTDEDLERIFGPTKGEREGITNDQEMQGRVQGVKREGEELGRAVQEQGRGREEAETGGILQKQEEIVNVNVARETKDQGLKKGDIISDANIRFDGEWPGVGYQWTDLTKGQESSFVTENLSPDEAKAKVKTIRAAYATETPEEKQAKIEIDNTPIQDVINNPKATQKEVIAEKTKLKAQVVQGVKSGDFDGAVRFGTVDEIKTILKTGKMPVSEEYGAIHAQPIMGKADDTFAAYGAYDKHNMAIVFPKDSIIEKKDRHTKEVLINEKVDVRDLRFLIDGHEKVYTFDELEGAISKPTPAKEEVKKNDLSDDELLNQFKDASIKNYKSNTERNKALNPLKDEIRNRKLPIPDISIPETKKYKVSETAEEQDQARSEALKKQREATDLAKQEVKETEKGIALFLKESDTQNIKAPKGRSLLSVKGVQSIVDRVKAKFPNIGNIRIVQSQDDPSLAPIYEIVGYPKKEKVFAVWDGNNDSIVIVADSVSSADSLINTIIHEGIGHRGVDAILNKGQRRRLFNLVYKDYKDSDLAAKIINDNKLDLEKPVDQVTFAREVIAHMATNEPRATLLDRIVSFIKQVCRSLKIPLKLTDAEIRNLLRRSAEFAQTGRGGVEGRGIAFQKQAITETPEFKKFFGDSKVTVDGKAGSEPLVVYHGTPEGDIEIFDRAKLKRGTGFHFTRSKKVASDYGNSIVPVYLRLENPLKLHTKSGELEWDRAKQISKDKNITLTEALKNMGYDGVLWGDFLKSGEIEVFESTQIKSIYNRGTFDPDDPRISFSKEATFDEITKEPHGEYTKESKLAKRTEADAIEKKLAEDFGDLVEYKTKEGFMKDQAEQAVQFLNSDYESAEKVAFGNGRPPGDLRVATVYEAVKLRALNENNKDLLYRLATESTVPTTLSEYGQEIKAADSSVEGDPVKAMQDIEKDRKAKNKRQGKKVVSIEKVKELKKKLAEAEEKLKEYEGKSDDENIETTIDKLIEKAPKKLYKKTNSKILKEQIKTSVDQGNDYSDISTDIQELAKYFITQGVTERNALVKEVHNVIKGIIPGITLRETMDAISGYGKFKPLSKDDVLIKLRDLKGQMQQVAKLMDMQAGRAPLKTGIERRTPTDEERRLIKQVEEMKKELGIETVDPEKQLKSALDSVKTRLSNQIKDLEYQIESGEKIVKKKTGLKYDVEAKRLQDRRDELKKQFDDIFGKPEITDEQRINMAIRAVEKSIVEYTRRINENDLAPAAKRTPVQSEQLNKLREDRDALKAKVKELRDLQKPKKTPEEISLQRLKTRLTNETKKLTDKLEKLDLQKAEKRETILDAEGRKLKADRDTLKAAFDAAVNSSGIVTREEADRLVELSRVMADARKEMEDGGDRFKYGAAKWNFTEYINYLKGQDRSIAAMMKDEWEEIKTTWKDNKAKVILFDIPRDIISTFADIAITLNATWDNSFIGRQGRHTALTHNEIWRDASKKSFIDIYKSLVSEHGAKEVRKMLMTDVYSRANYLSGAYTTAKLITNNEEENPSSIPGRIPYIGRTFKASDAAFRNTALRMRLDTFDLLQRIAEMQGVNVNDKVWIQETGKLINSVTARGDLGRVGDSRLLRFVFWAPKMMWGNINVLTAHFGGAGLKHPFARQQARKNLMKIVGFTVLAAAILDGLGRLFDKDDLIEWDPRSSDFMKMKIGNTRYDLTAGTGAYVILAARTIATLFGYKSIKNTKTGELEKLNTQNWGSKNMLDVAMDFFFNKTGPLFGVGIDVLRGKNFDYEKPNLKNVSYDLTTSIGLRNFIKAFKREGGVKTEEIVGNILEIFGVSSSTYDSDREMRKKYRELRKESK